MIAYGGCLNLPPLDASLPIAGVGRQMRFPSGTGTNIDTAPH